MRKVLFKRFIPAIFIQYNGIESEIKTRETSKIKQGTGKWEDDFTHEGLFHQWGNECHENEEGLGTDTVALVELPDGTIEQVYPFNIKFVIPYTKKEVELSNGRVMTVNNNVIERGVPFDEDLKK